MASIREIEIKHINNECWLSVRGYFNGRRLIHSNYQWLDKYSIQINLEIDQWPPDGVHIAALSRFEQHYNLRNIHPGKYAVRLNDDVRYFSI